MKIPFMFLAFFVSFQPNVFSVKKRKSSQGHVKTVKKPRVENFEEVESSESKESVDVKSDRYMRNLAFFDQYCKEEERKFLRSQQGSYFRNAKEEGLNLDIMRKFSLSSELPQFFKRHKDGSKLYMLQFSYVSFCKRVECFEQNFKDILTLQNNEYMHEKFLLLNKLLSQIIDDCTWLVKSIQEEFSDNVSIILEQVVQNTSLFCEQLLTLYKNISIEFLKFDSSEKRSIVAKCYSDSNKKNLLNALSTLNALSILYSVDSRVNEIIIGPGILDVLKAPKADGLIDGVFAELRKTHLSKRETYLSKGWSYLFG